MTSGTTGKPVLIPFDEKEYFGVWCETSARSLWASGVRKSDVVHVTFGFSQFLGLFGAYDACEHLIGCQVVPVGSLDSMQRLDMIRDMKVTVLLGTASYLLHLADVAREHGIDPKSLGIRIISTSGEPGMISAPNTAVRLREAYGSKIYERGGTQETNHMFGTCDYENAHLNDDLLYFEVLNPETNEPVADGQPGKLVISNLILKTHPVIRFETGDLVRGIERGVSCPCGRTLSHLKGFIGRTGDVIKIRGAAVSVTGVENVIRSIPECSNNYEYKAATNEKTGMDQIIVYVEPREDVEESAWENVHRKVKDALYVAFMVSMDVEVVPPRTLSVFDYKAKRFHDLRKANAGA
jgi:phenylacetate-CoA ligase